MEITLNEYTSVTTGIEAESVEELLGHIAHQTKNIDDKLSSVIHEQIAEDLQNYYNRVNDTLAMFNEKE